MVTDRRVDKPVIGAAFYIGNLLIMVLISGLVKLLAEIYPVSQLLFFRYVFAVIPLLIYALLAHGAASLKTARYRDHGIRSVAGVLGISLFFYAIALIPMAEATMLGYASPIFVTILSIPILSEKIGIKRWGAVLIGFTGVIIVARPGSAMFSPGGLVAAASALAAAFVVIWLRKLSDTEHGTTTSIIYNGSGAAVFIIWVLCAGWVEVSGAFHWLLLAAVGLAAAFQQFFFTVAFRYSEASYLAPFEYLILVFSAIAGYIFWHEIPRPASIIGGVFIVAGGLIILARSKRPS